MDIILLERIEKLGTIGDVVTVKDGYARNFLLPQKKTLRANAANKAVFEANRERLEKENAEKRTVAEGLGAKVEGAQVVLIRAASNAGQLYGSVNVRDMVAGLVEQGHDVDKKQVIMGAPIKAIGMHDVTVALHPECLSTKRFVSARPTARPMRVSRLRIFLPVGFLSKRTRKPNPVRSSPSSLVFRTMAGFISRKLKFFITVWTIVRPALVSAPALPA